MFFAVLLCLTYSFHFSIQSPILSPFSTPQHENEDKNDSTNCDDWSIAASTHVVGILPMLTAQFISLIITTPETGTVNFTVSSLTQTIAKGSVTAGTPTNISDPTLLPYHVNSESERYKGLLVTTGTNKKISLTVAMSHFGDYSAGMYVNYPALVYPVNSYVYYAVSIGTDESTSFSSLLIVSGNNNTNITITPTVTVTIPSSLTSSGNQISLNAGQSITIQLQYLETLLLKPVTARADLTGTKVESSNPISVYSGHTCGFIPVGQFACDFVGEQIPPVASWGNESLVQSFYKRESGYILKLIGSQNNTGIGITCDNGNSYSLSLQEGGVLSQTISQTSCYINSTSPILVAQFSLAQFADSSFTTHGDPAMTIIPPIHQYASNVTSFPIISLLGASTSVNLVILAADDSSQIQLNGTLLPPLTSSSWKHYNSSVGGCYVFNSYSLSDGGDISVISIWSNNSNDKILAMVYGLQQFIGYSYTGNLDLKPSGACFLLCDANYVLNTATCTCSITNICLLSPCQNGGNCTLDSAPSNYTCDCTGTGYQGINCTDEVPVSTTLLQQISSSSIQQLSKPSSFNISSFMLYSTTLSTSSLKSSSTLSDTTTSPPSSNSMTSFTSSSSAVSATNMTPSKSQPSMTQTTIKSSVMTSVSDFSKTQSSTISHSSITPSISQPSVSLSISQSSISLSVKQSSSTSQSSVTQSVSESSITSSMISTVTSSFINQQSVTQSINESSSLSSTNSQSSMMPSISQTSISTVLSTSQLNTGLSTSSITKSITSSPSISQSVIESSINVSSTIPSINQASSVQTSVISLTETTTTATFQSSTSFPSPSPSPEGPHVYMNTTVQAVNDTTVQLNCSRAFPPSTINWHFNGSKLSNSMKYNITRSNLLYIYNVSVNDAGVYYCGTSDVFDDATSDRVMLSVQVPPTFYDATLTDKAVVIGKSINLQCLVFGVPQPVVTWLKEGVNVIDSQYITNNVISDNRVSSVLTIDNSERISQGNYMCQASNDLVEKRSINATAYVAIYFPANIQPDNERIEAVWNETANISFTITNKEDIKNITNIKWEFKSITNNAYSSIFGSKLYRVFSSINVNDRGLYRIIVTTEAGIVTSMATELDVFVPAVLLSYNGEEKERKSGQNVTFNCTADGLPRPKIVWRKDGQLIIEGRKRIISTSQEIKGFRNISDVQQITSTLTITDLVRGVDNGSYSCRADNEANIGDILDTSYTLVIDPLDEVPPPQNYCLPFPCQNGICESLNGDFLCICDEKFTGKHCQIEVINYIAPVITEPPKHTTASLYSSASLTCRATGSPTPTIHWYKDNRIIGNKNSDPSVLVFPELDLSDRGFYHCVASNIINGKKEAIKSPVILLNITNVVQYEAEMDLPPDFYNSTESTEDLILKLIQSSNNYLSGSNISNTSFFYIEIFNAETILQNTSHMPDKLPIVVTLVTERGQGDNTLLTGVKNQLDSLNQQLSVKISIIELNRFDGCPSNSTIIPSQSGDTRLDISVHWPETNIGVEAIVDCPCGDNDTSSSGSELKAFRYCGGDFTNGAFWTTIDVSRCNFSDLARKICNLRNLPVDRKVQQLEELTSNTQELKSTEVTASVSILVTATNDVSGNITLTSTFLEVVDNILVVNQEVLEESQKSSNTSAKLLEAIESVAENIPITNSSEPVVIAQTSFAVSIQQVDLDDFEESGQNFSVVINNTSKGNLSSESLSFGMPISSPTASISLPKSLFNAVPHFINNTRITNLVFLSESMFLRRSFSYLKVSSIIVSASVVGAGTIRGIKPPVDLSFQLDSNSNGTNPQCTFWNQSFDGGYGDWSSEGCNTSNNDSQVMCQCDHLTSFAILLDASPIIEPTERTGLTLFLDSITYIGIVISLVCLTITVTTYLSSKKLRTSDHGQLLLNLCFALMGLYISFIAALHSRYAESFCLFFATVLQYFFLVTFMVMAAEAINLYMNLVIVLGGKIHHFILKSTIVSWITPFFIVLFCFAPNYKNYMNDPSNFCRAYNAPFYIGMLTPFIIIYIFNWIIFTIIILSLTHKSLKSNLKDTKSKTKDKSPRALIKQQFIIAITLSVLFGLGWGIGLLATEDIYSNKTARDVFASLFVMATAFHGLFIFLMHCLRSKDAQHVWKKWFVRVTGRELSDLTTSTFSRGTKRKRVIESRARKISNSNYSSSYSAPISEKKGSISIKEYDLKTFKNEDDIQKGDLIKEEDESNIPEENTKEDMAHQDDTTITVAVEMTVSNTDPEATKSDPVVSETTFTKPDDNKTEGPEAPELYVKDEQKVIQQENEDNTITTEITVEPEANRSPSTGATNVAVTVSEKKFTASFPEDDDDKYEKERLRQEEERAYNAYHKKE